ncbi:MULTISPECIES: conjugal transfer protein TraD [unclassified Xanthobacter]|nr:MAG: conjugal transfer protein TraD [Azorhizobium sp. 32-67-21]OYZ99116.1 MAG: conjugal transfer protein TraD [Rhizobiales bacterium 17-65-6]
MTEARRRDARQTFLLGGLVVRAGLGEADRAFLLGALIEARRIAPGSDEHERLKAIGQDAFRQRPADDMPEPDPEHGEEP